MGTAGKATEQDRGPERPGQRDDGPGHGDKDLETEGQARPGRGGRQGRGREGQGRGQKAKDVGSRAKRLVNP